jgi:hypothetical protein
VEAIHREEPRASRLEQLAELHEVWMLHVAQHAELGLEAQHGVGSDPPQRLEGYLDATFAIERAIHDAHPTASEDVEHLEPAVDERR